VRRVKRVRAQAGVRGETEIVVRGEVDDLTMVEDRGRLLLAVENSQMPIQTLLFECVEFDGEIVERIATHMIDGRGKAHELAIRDHLIDGDSPW